ncbi:MAG: hypothetical protein AAGK32_08800, partial [Actinomycetota bacterium]
MALAGAESMTAVSDRRETRTSPRIRRLDRPAPDPHVGLVVAGIGLAAVLVGVAAGTSPLLAVVVVVGGLIAVALARNPMAATGVLIVSFFFDDLLTSGGLVTPGKLIGVLAVTAWLVDTVRTGKPIRTVPHFWPIGLLIIWLVPSLSVVEDTGLGLTFASRYLMFAALFFLVVQTVDGRYRRARILG